MDVELAAPPAPPTDDVRTAVASDQPEPDPTSTAVVVNFDGPYTLDEIARVEAVTGLSVARWFDGDSPEGELRKVLAWVLACRVDPDADLAPFGALMVMVR